MTAKCDEISAWQTGILMFFLIFANKILTLPSLLYESAKMEAFFIPAVLFLLELGLLWLFYKLKTKFPQESFYQILTKKTGTIVAFLTYFLFLIFFFGKAALVYNVTYNFFKSLIYRDSDNLIFLFCFLPVVNHMAILGMKVLGRTGQLFFPMVATIVLFCLGVGFVGVDKMPLMFQTPIGAVAQTALKHIFAFGDVCFLFLIMEKIKIKPGQWKVIFSFGGAAMLCAFLVNFVFLLSYSYTAFMHPFALFEITSFLKEYGGLGRIDVISMIAIIIFTYFQLAVYLKMFMICFKKILPKWKEIYAVLSFDFALILLINFVILDLGTATYFGENILPYLGSFSFVWLPIVVAICLLKNDLKQKNMQKNSQINLKKSKNNYEKNYVKYHLKNIKKNKENQENLAGDFDKKFIIKKFDKKFKKSKIALPNAKNGHFCNKNSLFFLPFEVQK